MSILKHLTKIQHLQNILQIFKNIFLCYSSTSRRAGMRIQKPYPTYCGEDSPESGERNKAIKEARSTSPGSLSDSGRRRRGANTILTVIHCRETRRHKHRKKLLIKTINASYFVYANCPGDIYRTRNISYFKHALLNYSRRSQLLGHRTVDATVDCSVNNWSWNRTSRIAALAERVGVRRCGCVDLCAQVLRVNEDDLLFLVYLACM